MSRERSEHWQRLFDLFEEAVTLDPSAQVATEDSVLVGQSFDVVAYLGCWRKDWADWGLFRVTLSQGDEILRESWEECPPVGEVNNCFTSELAATLDEPGTYEFSVEATSPLAIEETDLTNNRASATVVVVAPNQGETH